MKGLKNIAIGAFFGTALLVAFAVGGTATAASLCPPDDPNCIKIGSTIELSGSYNGTSQTNCPAMPPLGFPSLIVGPVSHAADLTMTLYKNQFITEERSYSIQPSLSRYPSIERHYIAYSLPQSAVVSMIGLDRYSGQASDFYQDCTYTDFSGSLVGYLNRAVIGGGSSLTIYKSSSGGMGFCLRGVTCPGGTFDWVLAQNFTVANDSSVIRQFIGSGAGGAGGGGGYTPPGGSAEGSNTRFVPVYPLLAIQVALPGQEPYLLSRSFSCGTTRTCTTAAFPAPGFGPFFYKEATHPENYPPSTTQSSGSISTTWRMQAASDSYSETSEWSNDQQLITGRGIVGFFEMGDPFTSIGVCSLGGSVFNGNYNAPRKLYYCATGYEVTKEGIDDIRTAIKSFENFSEVQQAARGTIVGKVYALNYTGTNLPPYRFPESYHAGIFDELVSWASGVALTGGLVRTSNIVADGNGRVIVCEEGDLNCPGTSTHNECTVEGQCITVSGAGTNQCSTNSNCSVPPPNTHTECSGYQCVSVPGSGTNACSSDRECRLIGPGCTVTASSAPNPPNVGTTVQWTAQSIGGSFPSSYTYEWSGSDSLTGVGSTVNRTYNYGGPKEALVTVKDSSGIVVTSCSNTVSVAEPISVQCSAVPASGSGPVLIGDDVTWSATATGGTGSYTYVWNGAVSGNTKEVQASYADSGIKFATVTVSDQNDPSLASVDCAASVAVFTEALNLSCSVTATLTNGTQITCPQDLGDGTTSQCVPEVPADAQVTWRANISGGTGTYTYQWKGTDIVAAAPADTTSTSLTYPKTYSSSGKKTGIAEVTSGFDTVACYNDINIVPSGSFNYEIADMNTVSLIQGMTSRQPVYLKLLSGNTENVQITYSGFPASANVYWDNGTVTENCSPSCGGFINIETTTATPAQNYTITVRGQSASGLIRQKTFILEVKAVGQPITGSCSADKTIAHASTFQPKRELVTWTPENIDGGDGTYVYEWLVDWEKMFPVTGAYGGDVSGSAFEIPSLQVGYAVPGTYPMQLSIISGAGTESTILDCGSITATQANFTVDPITISGTGEVVGASNTYLLGSTLTVETVVNNIGDEHVSEQVQGTLFVRPDFTYWFTDTLTVPLQYDQYGTAWEAAKRNTFSEIGAATEASGSIPISIDVLPPTIYPGNYYFMYCIDTTPEDNFYSGPNGFYGNIDEIDTDLTTFEIEGELDNCSPEVPVTISDAGAMVVHHTTPPDVSLVRIDDSGSSDLIEGTKVYNLAPGTHSVALMEITPDYTVKPSATVIQCDDEAALLNCLGMGSVSLTTVSFTGSDGVTTNFKRGTAEVDTGKYTHVYFTYSLPSNIDYRLSNGGNKNVYQGASISNTVTATQTLGSPSTQQISPQITRVQKVVGGNATNITFSKEGTTYSFEDITVAQPATIGINGGVATFNFQTSETTPTGTYRITITGSPLSVTPNDDATTFDITVGTAPKPDLTAFTPTASGTAVWAETNTFVANTAVTLTGVIKNIAESTDKNFTASYFGGASKINASDYLIENGLAANAERTVTYTQTLGAGNYPRQLCADTVPANPGAVAEEDETNNCSADTFSITMVEVGHIKTETSGAAPQGVTFKVDEVLGGPIFNNISADPGDNPHSVAASSGTAVDQVTVRRGCNASFTNCQPAQTATFTQSGGYAKANVTIGAGEYALVNFRYGSTPPGGQPRTDLEVKTRNSSNYSTSIIIKPGEAVDFRWSSSGQYSANTECTPSTSSGNFIGALPPEGERQGGTFTQGRAIRLTCADPGDGSTPPQEPWSSNTVEINIQPSFREF